MNKLKEIVLLCNERHGVFPGGEMDRRLDNIRELAHGAIDEQEKSDHWVGCLESAGVDNWSGYDYATQMMREEYGDEWW